MILHTEDLDQKPIPAVPSTKLKWNQEEPWNPDGSADVSLRELWTELVQEKDDKKRSKSSKHFQSKTKARIQEESKLISP